MNPAAELEALRPYIRAVVSRHVPPQDVPDVVQDVLLTAWKAWGNCTHPEARRYWAVGIARRKLQHLWRDEQRAFPVVGLDEARDVAAGLTPEEFMDRGAVWELLATVPPRAARMLWLAAEGYSCEEIAALVGLQPPAVKSALYRARQGIRGRLEGA